MSKSVSSSPAWLACGLFCLLVACVLALCATPAAHADDLVPGQPDLNPRKTGATAIQYDGGAVAFVEADLKTPFEEFGNPTGDMTLALENGRVHITFTPKDQGTFAGFFFNADIADKKTWIGGGYVGAVVDTATKTVSYDFQLAEECCGYAWPIAPIFASGSASAGGTTQTQYYLAIPSVEVLAAKVAIAALPSDPKDVLGDTNNADVANAAAVYLALPDSAKASLSNDERLLLAKCAIAVLPSDPFKVTAEHGSAIATANAIVGSLSAELQGEVDSNDDDKTMSSSKSYGRHLENAVWALDALDPVDNATSLAAGTYTGQVESSSNMGKSTSRRAIGFTVKSITVADGKATAIVEHGSNTSQTIRIGGVEYQNLQTDSTGKSYFEIPIRLNSTFHFSVKGKDATDDTDAITYEMTVTADESSMTPDAQEDGNASKSSSSSSAAAGTSSSRTGSGTNLNTLVRNSTTSSASSKSSTAASSSAAAASKEAVSATASASRTGSSNAKAAREVELAAADGVLAFGSGEDLGPAVAGCVLLFVSAGSLAFTMRFLRRESATA